MTALRISQASAQRCSSARSMQYVMLQYLQISKTLAG